MSSDLFPVTLDRCYYAAKPKGLEDEITRRMQKAGPSHVTAGELCSHIRRGGTWAPGTFEASPSRWGEFRGLRLAGLDFDHDEGDPSGRSLFERVATRAQALRLSVLCFYPTFSSVQSQGASPAGWSRFRLVVDVGEVIAGKDEARAALAWLLAQFPEADQRCKNVNRLFFGAPGLVAEAWTWWPSVAGGGVQ